MRKRIVLILAAGRGTRMKSSHPKVLHTLLGKPIISRLIESLENLKPDRIYVILGHGAEAIPRPAGVKLQSRP